MKAAAQLLLTDNFVDRIVSTRVYTPQGTFFHKHEFGWRGTIQRARAGGLDPWSPR